MLDTDSLNEKRRAIAATQISRISYMNRDSQSGQSCRKVRDQRTRKWFLNWACIRPALIKRVGEDPYHPIVLCEMWSEELGPSATSLVCGPYEEHELLIV